MLTIRCGAAALMIIALSAPASAQSLDILQGKFAFNWRSKPAREKCVKVEGPLLSAFKSAKYKCDLKFVDNTASGEKARICTQGERGKEYMIFETRRSCENERTTQASNE